MDKTVGTFVFENNEKQRNKKLPNRFYSHNIYPTILQYYYDLYTYMIIDIIIIKFNYYIYHKSMYTYLPSIYW